MVGNDFLVSCEKNYALIFAGCKPPFDPENLLGVIPTTFLAYLGVQAGRILGSIFSIERSLSSSSF